MSKSNVNPNHYKVAGRERQGEDIAQARNRQKHAQSLARRRSESEARLPVPAPMGDSTLSGTAQTRAAKTATRGAVPELTTKQATTRARVNLQGADKRGKRSTAQKRASSRHEFDPIPATRAVAGAFGKEPSPRRRPTRKG